MADDEEAEWESRGQSRSPSVLRVLSTRLENLSVALRVSAEEEEEATAHYCRAFCKVGQPIEVAHSSALAQCTTAEVWISQSV